MRELLASTGNRNNPKFDSIMQSIIGAGAANDTHAETAEKRELEAFQAGRKSEAYSPPDGSLGVYIEDG